MSVVVVAHVAVSLDGRTAGFEVDQAAYYQLLDIWREDVTLTGADTILAQEPALARADLPGPSPDGPLLAVIDGRSRVSSWDALLRAGHWRDVVAIRAEQTGSSGVEELAAGGGAGSDGHVDLARAIDILGSAYQAKTVRVDSGGSLIGALLAAHRVNEVSLLVHPVVLGSGPFWYGTYDGSLTLKHAGTTTLDGGLVHLRYTVRGV